MGQTAQQQSQNISIQPTPPIKPVTNEINFLSGYKTYIVAGAMVLYALTGYYLNNMNQVQAWTIVFNALGIVGIRSGIESLKNL